jgi:hypothetical protein
MDASTSVRGMKWSDKIEAWKRKLPPAVWEALIARGRDQPCICDNKPNLLCWRCISLSQRPLAQRQPDVLVRDEGTIFLFSPLTTRAREWIAEHVDAQWFGDSLVVEHRYARALAAGMQQDDLILE